MAPPTPAPLLLLAFSSILFRFFQISAASCSPSACGVLRNISYPFRLKHDSKHCGDHRFELVCEDDEAYLSFNSHRHYVKEINYLNSTIRLADASINTHDTCSFPNYSLYRSNFSYYSYDKRINYPDYQITSSSSPFEDGALPVNLMRCQHPLENSSLFTETTRCHSNSSHPGFSYIKVGHMNASEVPESCGVEVIVLTSWEFRDLKNVSLSEIHHSLLYGFLLTPCTKCFTITKFERFIESKWSTAVYCVVCMLGLVCAAVSPPMFTIFGCGALAFLAYISLGLTPYIIYLLTTNANFLALLRVLIPAAFVNIILAVRIILFLAVMCFLIHKYRRRHLSMYEEIESFLQSDNKLMPIRYSYFEVKKMTRGFQDKLGEGGYSSVYKGKLQSGHDVAVKLLGKSGANGKDFINEIATIGRVHHVNIVKLVGYCAQGSKYALIFDFMSNGSLEKYLFKSEKGKSLNLNKKFEIAIGVARGIEYLHKGCDVQILHFDIKPHNILLDDKFIPKISDFGLAKFCSTNKTTVTMTCVRGTIGYVAPELISRSIGPVSYKADVYSFGMLLMEIVSLKRDLIGNNGDSGKCFPYWIYECLEQDKDVGFEIGDENTDNDCIRRLAQKMTIVALWCIQMNPNDRPSMKKVIEMLEGDLESLPIPNYSSKSSLIGVYEDDCGSETTHSTNCAPLLNHDSITFDFEVKVEE